MILGIAVVDWQTQAYISLGFLYLFPIMILGGFLSRTQIVGVALLCAFLQERFSYLPPGETWTRLVLSSAGLIGSGLFISEILRGRRVALQHMDELENALRGRREAEEHLKVLVESSPAAIITVDGEGCILLANEAAQEMLAPDGPALKGQGTEQYLPALTTAVRSRREKNFRTTLQCRGQRADGEVFLAGVWFSTYCSEGGNRLAAIFVDLSEELRSREDLNLDYLLTNTRILMSAVSHEIRNLCGAALVVHKNLESVPELHGNEDFGALGTLIHGLEQISAMELSGKSQPRTAVELEPVLDELRVLIESVASEREITVAWEETSPPPLVWADRYALLQVFLNLSKNAMRAMEQVAQRRLTVSVASEGEQVVVRFQDTGLGVTDPQHLFRPFKSAAGGTGLGLYVSRAMVKSFGGDLVYEPRDGGCCFAVVLQQANEETFHE